MNKAVQKQLAKLGAKEQKRLEAPAKEPGLSAKLIEKVPPGLKTTLDTAFAKAFEVVFTKGTPIIDKSYDKEAVAFRFDVSNYAVDRKTTKKTLRAVDKNANRTGLLSHGLSVASGAGLGVLGIGLPDIPIFLGLLLRGLYETAQSYGFCCDTPTERVYLLRLIRTALTDGEARARSTAALDISLCGGASLEEEIRLTAAALSDAMLVSKFLQGIPIVGITGGISNHIVYRQVLQLAKLKYKQRYLYTKL